MGHFASFRAMRLYIIYKSSRTLQPKIQKSTLLVEE